MFFFFGWNCLSLSVIRILLSMWTVAELIEIKDVNENGVRLIINYNEKNKHN